MGGVLQAICGVCIDGEHNVGKYISNGSEEVQVFPRFDLELDALVSAGDLFFDLLYERLRVFANSKGCAAGNFFSRSAQRFQRGLDLCWDSTSQSAFSTPALAM